MSSIPRHTITACLIGSGAVVWALAGQPLVLDRELRAPLNPMGINGSPYGEVFAMAMQGPIDTTFHASSGTGFHQHVSGKECSACKKSAAQVESAARFQPTLGQRYENLLTSLDKVEQIRTNPKAASAAHRLFLRRQAEDKLRFAYQLDKSHYANYNSLHFFYTEASIGTRPELTSSAAQLAEETIQYCLKKQSDPRPILTAAGACTNVLQLMFADHKSVPPKFNTMQMRQYLMVLDHCIARYITEAKAWDQSKHWDLLSPQRIAECDERFDFICKIRDAADKTVLRYEGEAQSQATN